MDDKICTWYGEKGREPSGKDLSKHRRSKNKRENMKGHNLVSVEV